MNKLRSEALRCFKKLHKTRKSVFDGDHNALFEARIQINHEFKKNKDEKDENKIQEMIKYGNDVEHELRTTVIQAVKVKDEVYELKIRDDIVKLDNFPFDENADIKPRSPNKKCR